MSGFSCSDQTIRGQTDQLVTVPCDTFCVVAFSINSFLSAFEGIDIPVCQAVGCAMLDAQGNYVNDAADKLGQAASGDITVFRCDNSTFFENPGALQVSEESGLPCNYFNPDGASGIIDPEAQVCVGLEEIGTGFNEPIWILENLGAFIGIVIGSIFVFIIALTALCCWRRKQQGKRTRLRDTIELNEGMTFVNFGGFLVVGGTTIMLLVFMNAMQAFLLVDNYGVQEGDFGSVTGQLTVADEVWSFVCLFAWGVASDFTGRRLVVCSGYVLCGFALFLFPHGRDVYPGLLLIRLIFATGGAALATMLTALLSDIVAPSSLGIGAGILGILSGVGALFAAFVLIGAVPAQVCLNNTYYIVASMCVVLTILSFALLPKHHRNDNSEEDQSGLIEHSLRRNIRKQVARGFVLVRERRELVSAYVAGFCARAGSVIVSAYIALWVVQFYTETDRCNTISADNEATNCGESLINAEERICASAYTVASRITGTAQSSALLLSFFWGWIATRPWANVQACLFVAALLGVLAYGLVPAFDDPLSTRLYGVAALWGAAQIAMIVFAQVAVAYEMQSFPDVKGVIAGSYSAAGSLGIILISYFGGLLFDAWTPLAPFLLMSLASGVVAAVSFYVLLRDPSRPMQHLMSKA